MLSRSGGPCCETSEGNESELADPGVGALTDDDDKDDGEGDFTGRFWGCVSCCSVRGDNRTKVFMSKSQ